MKIESYGKKSFLERVVDLLRSLFQKRSVYFVVRYFVFVVAVNLWFWFLVGLDFGPVDDLYSEGLVIKVRPLGFAYVFAHGSYDYGWEWNDEYGLIRGYGLIFNVVQMTDGLKDGLTCETTGRVWGQKNDWVVAYKD